MAISKEHLIQGGFLVASALATYWIYHSGSQVSPGNAAGTPVELPAPSLPVQTISTQPASTYVSDLPSVGPTNLGPPSSVSPNAIYNFAGSTFGPVGGADISSPDNVSLINYPSSLGFNSPMQGIIGNGASAPSSQCGCCNSPPAQGNAFATMQDMLNQLPAQSYTSNPFDAGQFTGAGGEGFFS